MRTKRIHVMLGMLVLCACAIPFRARLRRPLVAAIQIVRGRKTVADRVAQYGTAVRARLCPIFATMGMPYPPERVTLVGLKAEQRVEAWAAGRDGQWRHIKDYPILGMSGVLGPKLREGDMQVPEGIYRVESLNPNSLYHLALRVNYPNPEDRRRGKQDGREELGSDIMIHGKDCSIGCLAMGDEAAEDLFVLAAETGIDNITIVLSPVDFRVRGLPRDMPTTPEWTPQLYDSIRQELIKMETPAQGSGLSPGSPARSERIVAPHARTLDAIPADRSSAAPSRFRTDISRVATAT